MSISSVSSAAAAAPAARAQSAAPQRLDADGDRDNDAGESRKAALTPNLGAMLDTTA